LTDESKPDDLVTQTGPLDAASRAAIATAPGSGPRAIGGFRILGKLGEGGMGIVYEAEQRSPQRRVALKVIRGGQMVDEVSLRLFRREAETLARMAHPNIAAIYEAGSTEDGQHFFTMELVAGRTLNAFMHERLGADQPTAAQLRERLRLFITICRAVNYAHQRGVIHRDLKPSNVLVTETGDVKILDFGLARIMDAEVAAGSLVTAMGSIKGTLAYMSPEQARGDSDAIDLRTDVYSLGVLLYELLSGEHPYETGSSSVLQAIRAICEDAPRNLTATAGGVAIDADLRTVTAKALEKEADRRYQSAGALAEDVERYLANLPILAHPPSTLYQLRKLVSRHKGRVAAMGTIVALLLALMATSIVQTQRVRQERDRATAEADKAGAINHFLLDALGGADPWSQGSRTVTLVDALHQAQTKAHAAFASQPLVEAAVLQTIGTTLGGLAEFALADTALRAALDLRTATVGRHSNESAEALGALAALCLRWGRYAEAEPYAREALSIASELHGATSPEVAAYRVDVATAVCKQGRNADAKQLAQESLGIARALRDASGRPPADGVEAGKIEANALTVLAEIAMNENDFPEQEKLSRERLQLVQSRQASPSADLAQALNDFATAQMLNGDLEGATRSYQEAIDMAIAALGDAHPEVASYRENLGNVYFRAGKLDLTASNLELVLAMRRKALGDDSEPVARTLANMGMVYLRVGNLERAEPTFREAAERLTSKLGPDHPDVGMTVATLGEVLRQRKKFAESEPTMLRGIAVLTKTQGEAAPVTQWAIQNLVKLYDGLGKPQQVAVWSAKLAKAK
jgi:serine/threonine protein kinase